MDPSLDASEFSPMMWTMPFANATPVTGAALARYDDINCGAAQLKAEFDWQIHAKDQEIEYLQAQLRKMAQEDLKIKAQWDQDRSDLLWEIDRHSEMLKRNGIKIGDAIPNLEMLRSQLSWSSSVRDRLKNPRGPSTAAPGLGQPAPRAMPMARQDQPLESHMQRLNDLLNQHRSPSPCAIEELSSPHEDVQAPLMPLGSAGGSDGPTADQHIFATLQSVFPGATFRTSQTREDDAPAGRQRRVQWRLEPEICGLEAEAAEATGRGGLPPPVADVAREKRYVREAPGEDLNGNEQRWLPSTRTSPLPGGALVHPKILRRGELKSESEPAEAPKKLEEAPVKSLP
jgi:hypothetical protein